MVGSKSVPLIEDAGSAACREPDVDLVCLRFGFRKDIAGRLYAIVWLHLVCHLGDGPRGRGRN